VPRLHHKRPKFFRNFFNRCRRGAWPFAFERGGGSAGQFLADDRGEFFGDHLMSEFVGVGIEAIDDEGDGFAVFDLCSRGAGFARLAIL